MKNSKCTFENQSTLKKDRYLDHLSEEENEMLNIIANIIAKHVIRTVDEQKKEPSPQKESNRYYSDSK